MTLLLNTMIAYSSVIKEPTCILMAIRDTQEYDNDNHPTGKTIGHTITCVEMDNFHTIKVKIPKGKLEITSEALQKARANGERVFIELEDAYIKPYWNSTTKSVEDSITASGFHIIDTKL